MRKILVTLFVLICLNSFAQGTVESTKPYYFYLQLHPFAWAGSKEWRGDICLDGYEPYVICDDNNEKIIFFWANANCKLLIQSRLGICQL